jgi:hypothetical protein
MSNDRYKILYMSSMVTYQALNFLVAMMLERVLYRHDVRLQICCKGNCQTCLCLEPPDVHDVRLLYVLGHDHEHRLMGVRPSRHVLCHVGHPSGRSVVALTIKLEM